MTADTTLPADLTPDDLVAAMFEVAPDATALAALADLFPEDEGDDGAE